MNVFFFTSDDIKFITLKIKDSFKFQYLQKIDYSKNLNSKTIAYNYGPLADKWVSEITIVDTKANLATYSEYLIDNRGQFYIQCNEAEQIFGAGIDYTEEIQCNLISSTLKYSQENIALSELTIKLEAIAYNTNPTEMLKYKNSIPSGLPSKLNFQTPIDKDMIKRVSAYQSENFGEFGYITESNGTVCSFSEEISIVFNQNEVEASQIEKFVNTQRSTPFTFTQANIVYLFKNQGISNVMITGIVSTRVSHDNWVITLKLVTNV